MPWRGLALPLLLMVAGVACIGLAALLEEIYQGDRPWRTALLVPEHEIPGDGLETVFTRRIPLDQERTVSVVLDTLLSTPEGAAAISETGLDDTPLVVAMPGGSERLEPILASGRLPEAGKPEVLAGSLTRLRAFTLSGVTFEVVGTVRPDVRNFAYAYVLPWDDALDSVFSPEAGAALGVFAEDAAALLEALEDSDESPALEVAFPYGRRYLGFSLLVIAGLVITACGGTLLHWRIFRHWPLPLWARPVTRDIARFPWLFLAMHVIMYGGLFMAMGLALAFPLANYTVLSYITHQFSEGALGYVGAAYDSGNILRAAAATFLNNYVLQTCVFTFIISLPPFCLGFFKTLLSFAVAGFGMSPLWLDGTTHLTYHAITMVLELEAYILASFIVVLWPLRLVLGVHQGMLGAEALAGLRSFGAGLLLTGFMLAIAAIYEATTLILLRF